MGPRSQTRGRLHAWTHTNANKGALKTLSVCAHITLLNKQEEKLTKKYEVTSFAGTSLLAAEHDVGVAHGKADRVREAKRVVVCTHGHIRKQRYL